MNTGETIQKAYDTVNALEMDDQFKLVAFRTLIQAELGGGVAVVDAQIKQGATQDTVNRKQQSSSNKGDWKYKIASNLEITEEQVLEVFHMNEKGELEIVIERKDIPTATSGAIKLIAMLYAGGRQAAGIESSTLVEEIRNVCKDSYKVEDNNNFSSHISGLGAKFRDTGASTGKDRTLTLINGAYKTVGEAIKKVLEKK